MVGIGRSNWRVGTVLTTDFPDGHGSRASTFRRQFYPCPSAYPVYGISHKQQRKVSHFCFAGCLVTRKPMQDWEALQNYVEDQSDEAFRHLVDRHFNLVWATAFRLTGNHARAKDIAQDVFTDLAKRANRIGPKVVLQGWLYRATCFAAKNSNRREMRRCKHEREALAWHESEGHGLNQDEQQLIGNLDEALNKLSERDRNVLLQRFFGKKRVQEIADETGVSRAAAQKQISRAIDRLRRWYRQRNLSLSHSNLIVGLTLLGSQTAPLGLAAQVAGQTIAVASSPWWLSTAKVTIELMTIKKPILVGGLALAGISAPLVVQELRIREQRAALALEIQRKEALEGIPKAHEEWQRAQNEIAEFEKLTRDARERDGLKSELDELKSHGAEEKANKLALINQLASSLDEQQSALDDLEARREFKQLSRTTMAVGKDLALPFLMFAYSHDLQLPASFDELEAELQEDLEEEEGGTLNFMGLPLDNWSIIPHQGKLSDYNNGSLIVLRERETRFFDGKYHRVYAFGDGHSELVSREQLSEFDEFEIAKLENARKQP